MARASAKKAKSTAKPATPHPPLFYSLHTLLHTVRTIAHHEDQLCSLMNEVQTAGTLTGASQRELRQLLEELPSTTYLQDLHTVHQAMAQNRVSAKANQKRAATPAKRPRKRAGKPKQAARSKPARQVRKARPKA